LDVRADADVLPVDNQDFGEWRALSAGSCKRSIRQFPATGTNVVKLSSNEDFAQEA
jgi:hypothetical protein